MDAFYAAIEQRDFPELRGKPIAVGGSSERGVVMTASYEARKYGVRSAMPTVVAKRNCPELIVVKSRMDSYQEASRKIREIFSEYTDLVEPLSLDEAYLDVTSNKKQEAYATVLADEIKARIKAKVGITASAGVSYNKFLAKIASDIQKPDGLTVIRPDQAKAFLEGLPIESFHGVGQVTARKMHEMGIRNGGSLKAVSLEDLLSRFGKVGSYFFQVARGQDDREVRPNRVRKSVGVEITFSGNISGLENLEKELVSVVDRLMTRLEKSDRSGFTLTLKLKTSEFKILNRSLTGKQPFDNRETILQVAKKLLESVPLVQESFRLIGVQISNLQGISSDDLVKQKSFEFCYS